MKSRILIFRMRVNFALNALPVWQPAVPSAHFPGIIRFFALEKAKLLWEKMTNYLKDPRRQRFIPIPLKMPGIIRFLCAVIDASV